MQEATADWPFTVYETSDSPFVYAEAPCGCGGAAKHLDAVGKVLTKVLHCGWFSHHFPFARPRLA